MNDTSRALPNVAEVLAPLLARVPADRQPLLLAIAERLAAERYRGWAADPGYTADREALLRCAAREEEIAERIESLHKDATAVQREILTANPDLSEINRSVFAGLCVADQMRLQASGERTGAATWRAFAKRAQDAAVRSVFLECAGLEEASAAVLDEIVGR
jgi:hypothetical protein